MAFSLWSKAITTLMPLRQSAAVGCRYLTKISMRFLRRVSCLRLACNRSTTPALLASALRSVTFNSSIPPLLPDYGPLQLQMLPHSLQNYGTYRTASHSMSTSTVSNAFLSTLPSVRYLCSAGISATIVEYTATKTDHELCSFKRCAADASASAIQQYATRGEVLNGGLNSAADNAEPCCHR